MGGEAESDVPVMTGDVPTAVRMESGQNVGSGGTDGALDLSVAPLAFTSDPVPQLRLSGRPRPAASARNPEERVG